jgi:hypothetical protein
MLIEGRYMDSIDLIVYCSHTLTIEQRVEGYAWTGY